MTDQSGLQWNKEEIAKHLRSAVDTLAPDVLDQIDLSVPQEIYTGPSRVTRLYRRLRTAGIAVAACLCLVLLSGGVAGYQNRRVESVIGIDVNPSIELSVNRKDKVLKAVPLNADAAEVLDDMDLNNVDLDIAVNALIGSMVRHGYLNDLDNAILVTVANDDKEKASVLRQDVVVDIEASLEEHKVQAVVYDQQAPAVEEVQELAGKYDISYGKAYFLQELIDENDLRPEEMEAFAGMTMEEIAREIAERSYTVRGSRNTDADWEEQSTGESIRESTASTTEPVPEELPTEPVTTQAESSEIQTGAQETVPPSVSVTEPVTAPESTEDFTEEEKGGGKVRIDYVDFEAGHLNIVFKEKVKWKSPTVSVTDEGGQSYSAMIADTGSDSCEIVVRGLEGGADYTFILGGVALKEGGGYGSIRGYFDTPDIAEEILESDDPDDGGEEDSEPFAESSEPQSEEETAISQEETPESSQPDEQEEGANDAEETS